MGDEKRIKFEKEVSILERYDILSRGFFCTHAKKTKKCILVYIVEELYEEVRTY